MTISNFLKQFYEENSELNNVQLIDGDLVIIEDINRPIGNKMIFNSNSFQIVSNWGEETSENFDIREFTELETKSISFLFKTGRERGNYIFKNTKVGSYGGSFDEIKGLLENFKIKLKEFKVEEKSFLIQQAESDIALEEKRIKDLGESQTNVLNELDNDGDGIVDLIEGNDFNLLLKKHQKKVVEIDRNYVQQFVKVSSYLKRKKENIQLIFNSIKDTQNQEILNEYVGILKNEIHCYNLLLFNSLNMITSLVEDDMINFYEIYESFDKLNVFSSNWENEISKKLDNIGDGIDELMSSIQVLGDNIVAEIENLSYVSEESNRVLADQLSGIDSSIQVNNLLTGIQTYEMYKVNQNTKSLN
jgi:hypothetical protein